MLDLRIISVQIRFEARDLITSRRGFSDMVKELPQTIKRRNMHRILLILFGLSLFAGAAVAQNYRPEPVSVSKNVLRAYDRFHDRTTVMLKAFPVAASVGKQHYLLSMTTGFAFDGKVPSKRPDSILVYFRETSWTAISATDSLEDPRPRAKGENLYLNRQSEVIALADGERIKLPHGDETLDFNGGDES